MVTDDVAAAIQEKEARLWKNPITGEPKAPYMRVSDTNNLILLNDLNLKHKIHFVPIQKDNNEAAINNMRLLIKQERIIINPRCVTLIAHLRNAIWNKSRTSFTRSADSGHFDAIDSLKYLCRGIHLHKDPYPANYNLGRTDDLFFSKDYNNSPELHNSLKKMFQLPRSRKINK